MRQRPPRQRIEGNSTGIDPPGRRRNARCTGPVTPRPEEPVDRPHRTRTLAWLLAALLLGPAGARAVAAPAPAPTAAPAHTLVLDAIELTGTDRTSLEVVQRYLPLRPGQAIDQAGLVAAVDELRQSSLFAHVAFYTKPADRARSPGAGAGGDGARLGLPLGRRQHRPGRLVPGAGHAGAGQRVGPRRRAGPEVPPRPAPRGPVPGLRAAAPGRSAQLVGRAPERRVHRPALVRRRRGVPPRGGDRRRGGGAGPPLHSPLAGRGGPEVRGRPHRRPLPGLHRVGRRQHHATTRSSTPPTCRRASATAWATTSAPSCTWTCSTTPDRRGCGPARPRAACGAG